MNKPEKWEETLILSGRYDIAPTRNQAIEEYDKYHEQEIEKYKEYMRLDGTTCGAKDAKIKELQVKLDALPSEKECIQISCKYLYQMCTHKTQEDHEFLQDNADSLGKAIHKRIKESK